MFQFHCVDISLAPLADFFTYYVILIFEVRIIFPLWVLTGAPERKLRLTFDSHSLIFFFLDGLKCLGAEIRLELLCDCSVTVAELHYRHNHATFYCSTY